MLRFHIKVEAKVEKTTVKKLLYDRGNYDQMRLELRGINWQAELNQLQGGVQECWSHFLDIYHELVDKYVPVKHFRTAEQSVKGNKYSTKILRTVKRKHRLWQRYLETRDGQIYHIFKKKTRNKAKSCIRRCNRAFQKK